MLRPGGIAGDVGLTRNPFSPTVYVANDNGSAARKIGSGSNPHVSPDGQTVAFYRFGKGNKPAELMVAPAIGAAPRKLASGWRDPFVFAWSPDSTTVAALLGPEIGKQRLTLIDVATGTRQTVASGFFNGVSFSPAGGQLVYGRASKEFGSRATSTASTSRSGAVFVKAPRRFASATTIAPSPALGPERQDRLRQAARRKEAQVRPEERALPDERERQAGQAADPHEGRPAAQGLTRPPGRPTASGCWPSSAARTRATRSPSTPRPAPNGR